MSLCNLTSVDSVLNYTCDSNLNEGIEDTFVDQMDELTSFINLYEVQTDRCGEQNATNSSSRSATTSTNQDRTSEIVFPNMGIQQNVLSHANIWHRNQEYSLRERQRKHSHNIIERRRRCRINEKIKELEKLLYGHDIYQNSPRKKDSILAAAVDHIKTFQGYQEKLRHLEKRQCNIEQEMKTLMHKMQTTRLDDSPERKPESTTFKNSDATYIFEGFIPIYEEENDANNREIQCSYLITSRSDKN